MHPWTYQHGMARVDIAGVDNAGVGNLNTYVRNSLCSLHMSTPVFSTPPRFDSADLSTPANSINPSACPSVCLSRLFLNVNVVGRAQYDVWAYSK